MKRPPRCGSCGIVIEPMKFRGRLTKPASIKLTLFTGKSRMEVEAHFCLDCSKQLAAQIASNRGLFFKKFW